MKTATSLASNKPHSLTKPLALLASAALLAACSSEPASTAQSLEASPLPVGTTLHYLRSNQDGTRPEDIYVHIVSPTELAVMKRTAPCTDSALVTGRFNAETGEATTLTGGRLGEDTQQVPTAFLAFNADTRALDVRFGDPNTPEPMFSTTVPSAPWRMYDFDLSEFALFGPKSEAAFEPFTFGVAMAWPDPADPGLRMLGEVTATPTTNDITYSGDMPTVTYTVSGDSFSGGELILNASTGAVITAKFGEPNHPGYDDFMLQLKDTLPDEAAWQDLLTSHWADCPATSE
jgi:hypothetical protein